MSTELLGTSAVIRTLGNCGPPDPPWPSSPSSELSVATGTPPNCAAAVRGLAPPSAGEPGPLELGEAPPGELGEAPPAPPVRPANPPVSLSAAVIAFTPEPGAISFVGDSAETPPLVTKICCNNWAICLSSP